MDTLPDLFINTLRQPFGKYQKIALKIAKTASEDSVHDLRVLTRRILAVLHIIEKSAPALRAKKIKKRLKKNLRQLAPLRDLHIQIQLLERLLPDYPEAVLFLNQYKKKEKKSAKKIKKKFESVKLRKLRKRLDFVETQIENLLKEPESASHGLSIGLSEVNLAFSKVVDRKNKLNLSDFSTVHQMRMAFKKFRYLLEILRPVLPEINKKRKKEMKSFQKQMGEIQDLEVLMENLKSFKPRGAEKALFLKKMTADLEEKQKLLASKFIPASEKIYSFWRTGEHDTSEISGEAA